MRATQYALSLLLLAAGGVLAGYGHAPMAAASTSGTGPSFAGALATDAWQARLAQDDSQKVLSAARSTQVRFERLRRSHFPWTWDGSTRRCDEVVSRFCFWHDDDPSEPAPEHEEVSRAREALSAELERAAGILPGDEWIAGQRVKYLVEAGRHREALAAAIACRAAAGWWCAALAGFTLHFAGEFAGADSVFAGALTGYAVERTMSLE